MDDLDLAISAARAGAAIVTRYFGRGLGSDLKRQFDPVTRADRESEEAIVTVLTEARPEDGLLAEEGASAGDGSGRRWIIDPLDGTVNFVHGIPQVSVSIALHDDDGPLVGVVYDPFRDELFAAVRGKGTTLNGTPASVSTVSEAAQAVVAMGFPYDHGDYATEYAANLASVLEVVNGIRRMGSAALDFAWVAMGRYEAYWEMGLAPWDAAAGQLLVTEAGGTVTDVYGAAPTIDTRLFLASNGLLHDALVRRIQRSIPEHLRE